MSSHAALASDTSRSKSGILTPTSDASLNSGDRPYHDDEAGYSALRTRASGSPSLRMEDLLKPTIVVKPHPSGLHVRPRILHPLMLLPREHLSLSCLDLAQPHGDFSVSRFYESRIKILDLEGRLGSNLLIARSETNRVVYAIERQSDGLYTLCKLGAWVDLGKLATLATTICRQRLELSKPVPRPATGPVAHITPQIHKDNKKKRLAIEEIQSMVNKRARSQSIALVGTPEPNNDVSPNLNGLLGEGQGTKDSSKIERADIPTQPQTATSTAAIGDATLSQPTTEDIFQNIRTQYVEVLYHSMGSLAYFAKGPLSRARAAFHLDCDSNLEMIDLVDFLKSLVMTTVVIDKKFRETMPALISKFKTFVEDSDHGEAKAKKRKPKKMKLGKDGLYPAEEEHIRYWWNSHKATDPEEKSATGEEMKYHISCLRRRETQLQMIIIMEILALEPLARPKDNADDSQLPGQESQGGLSSTTETPAKKRSKHNYRVLLDVHADRLCIWQSTTLDEVKALAESQDQAAKSEKANADPLKDFCVDIILPFFSARLPEICDSINRKLGGPVINEPLKPRQSKQTTQPKAKPGAPMKKSASLRPDRERTLERVLSDEHRRRSVSRGPTSSALAQMRLASATTIPGLKKETSDSLLSLIPKQRERDSSVKPRTNSLFSRSSSTSSLMTEDQKARKKALVDAEVKEAISALKRPNRALVGKEIVQETEQRRASTSLSQLKKARKPVHRMPGVGSAYPAVQVKATPANNRFKDVIAAESQHAASLPELEMIKDEDDFEDRIPASSCVPSSAVTRRTTSTPLPAIQPTPARGSASAASLPSMMMAPISPVLIRKAFLAPLGTAIIAESSPAIGALFETPLKPRSAMGDLSTPIRPLRLTGAGTATPRPSLGIVATPEKTARRSTAPAVAGTPRRSAVVSDDRDLAVTATPQKIVLVTTNRNVAATLGKSSSEEVVVTKTLQPEERCTEENEPVKKTETVSIYKRLGWDDDYDLD